jgi:hypothetical protein
MDYINRKIKRFVRSEIKKRKRKGKIFEMKTPEELLGILKRIGGENRLSEKQYRDARGEGDPNPLTYYRRFGSWNNACEMVWGKKKLSINEILLSKCDEEYLVKLVNEFDVKDKNKYLLKRKEHPEIFPSRKVVESLFKNFTNLFNAAYLFSINEQLVLCLKLRLEMKRCPTMDDYKKAGINVNMLLRKYVTQKQVNKMVRILEEAYETKRGNQVKDVELDGKMLEREEKKEFAPFSDQLHI